jgi:hypothetical protein
LLGIAISGDQEDSMTGYALLYVVIAAAIFAAGLAFAARWHATNRFAVCPETGTKVKVAVDRDHAGKAVFTGEHLKVVNCERWPERAGCDRECEKHVHA